MSGTDSPGGAPMNHPGPPPGGTPPPGAGQPAAPYGGAPSAPPNQYPPSPQGPWSYGQPPGGPPPGSGNNSNKALWIILAAVAAFVVLALVAGIVLIAKSGGGDSSSATAAPGKAGTQTEAVKKYLEAVAAGDSKKALSYAAVQPLNKQFLTDDVLAKSAELAKITDIRVGQVANEYTSLVPVSFQLGDETVTEDYYVTKSGDNWKLRDAGSEFDFTNLRNNTLPLLINGKTLDVDKVTLFPGAYEVTSGSDYISYGETGRFTVKSNSDYLSSADLSPTLSPEGERAYVDAVKASTKACLQKKELSPANCPNHADGSQNYKIDKGSIKWTKRGQDPFANLKPRLDYDNPTIATSRPNLELRVTADCSSSSGKCSLDTYSYGEATVDMTKDPLAVKWADD